MMQRLILAVIVGGFLAFPASVGCADKADEQYIKVDAKGIIAADVVAIGAETTGTTMTVTLDGVAKITWELDLGDNKEWKELAKKLDKKLAVVTGTYSQKKGVEIPVRHIVKVTSFKAADGK
jgi:hypothetical protein